MTDQNVVVDLFRVVKNRVRRFELIAGVLSESVA